MSWADIFAGITAACYVLIAGTGVWALVYAKQQLKQARESEKVHHLVRFIEQFENEPMAGYRKALAEKRLKGTSYPPEAQYVLNFFETIGLLVRRGYLDADDVWSSFAYWMFNVYADLREDIEQEQRDDETYFGDFCSLIETLRKIEKDEGCSDDHPSREEIRDFWRDESKLTAGSPVRRRKPRKSKVVAESTHEVKKSGSDSVSLE
jgi:hypothetical protein